MNYCLPFHFQKNAPGIEAVKGGANTASCDEILRWVQTVLEAEISALACFNSSDDILTINLWQGPGNRPACTHLSDPQGTMVTWLHSGSESMIGTNQDHHLCRLVSRAIGETVHSAVAIPVRPHESKARILLAASRSTMSIGKREESILRTVAACSALQADAVWLREEFQRVSHYLDASVDIGKAIVSNMDFESLLGKILNRLQVIFDAESGGVLLYDPDRQELVLQKPAFGVSDEDKIRAYRVPVGVETSPITVAASVFNSGEPFVNNHCPENPRINQKFISLYKIKNSVTLPLIVDGRGIGILHIVNKRSGGFTDNDVRLLSMLASQLAVIIENGRLFNQLRRREQEAKALYEVGVEISSLLDPGPILLSVVEKTRYLLWSDMAGLSLLDERSGYASIRVAVGNQSQRMTRVRVRTPGSGVSGRALRKGRPVIQAYTLAPQNLDYRDDEADMAARAEGMRWAIAAPLQVGSRAMGILYAWRRNDQPFGSTEEELLSQLSNQAAIAIEKAELYAREKRTVTELTRLNTVIASQRAVLERSVEVHKKLTHLVLASRGIGAITETLSNLIQSPVMVKDQFHRLLAHSCGDRPVDPFWEETVKSGQSPAIVRETPALKIPFEVMDRDQCPVRIENHPGLGLEKPRLITPIVVDREILGYISVLENQSLEEVDQVAVEHAATVCALEMLKQKTALEAEYRVKSDFLSDLVRGRFQSEEEITRRGAYFGYDLSRTYSVMLVAFDQAPEEGDRKTSSARTRQLADLAQGLCADLLPESIAVTKGLNVLILARTPEPRKGASRSNSSTFRPEDLARQLQARAASSLGGLTVSIGIGRACTQVSDIKSSYEEARQAIGMVRRFGRKEAIIPFDNLGVYRLLFQVGQKKDLEEFVHKVLGSLIDYDSRHNTNLIATVDSYLRNNCNLQRTSKTSFVHINTLNYRLRRVEEITGLDFDRHDDRLNLEMALRVREILTS